MPRERWAVLSTDRAGDLIMDALSFLHEKGFDVTGSYSHGGAVVSVWSEDYEAARGLLEARPEYAHVLQPRDSKAPWERINRTSRHP